MSKFFIALSGIIFLLFSCSSDALVGQPDNESDEINESSITVSNVKTFIVDQSAADQTAAAKPVDSDSGRADQLSRCGAHRMAEALFDQL